MSEFLFSYFAAGFEKAFAEFTKKQEQRDMALLQKLQKLQANDELIQAAIAEKAQVEAALAALPELVKSNAEKDAQIKDLLVRVAAQETTIADAEAIVDSLSSERTAEVQAVSDIFTPVVSEEPTEPVAEQPTEEPAPIVEETI